MRGTLAREIPREVLTLDRSHHHRVARGGSRIEPIESVIGVDDLDVGMEHHERTEPERSAGDPQLDRLNVGADRALARLQPAPKL